MKFGLVLVAMSVFAGETTVTFEPAKTQVHWTLGTVLHTVHGTFQLKSGTIQFDPATGRASGLVVISALSGESGNESRDKKMHAGILESVRFPEVTFTPDRVTGQLTNESKSTLQVHGNFKLHGQGHEFTMGVEVEMKGGQATATSKFAVPYIKWGLKNPSTFVLRTNDTVEIEVEAIATVAQGS